MVTVIEWMFMLNINEKKNHGMTKMHRSIIYAKTNIKSFFLSLCSNNPFGVESNPLL